MKKLLIVTAAALALGACHREGPTDENSVNIVADNAYENVMPDESMMPVDNAAMNAANVAEAPPPPPSVTEQQQTQDDADVAGLTARINREAEVQTPVNREAEVQNSTEAVPVERK